MSIHPFFKVLLLLFVSAYVSLASADIPMTDAAGQKFALSEEANRIITLAPFITELMYAIGAGDKVIGTVEYSDFPPQAKNIPLIGRYNAVDEERVIALAPDLVIAWKTGTPSAITDRLRKMGIPVFFLEPSTLDDVRKSLLILGQLTGQHAASQSAARNYHNNLTQLRKHYANRKQLSVFYQIWDKPLMSIGGQQITSDMLALCGGSNIFAPVRKISFPVSIESIIKENPQVILVASKGEISKNWVSDWKKWPDIAAVRTGNVFSVNPDLMRHTPRIIQGVRQLCEILDVARKNASL